MNQYLIPCLAVAGLLTSIARAQDKLEFKDLRERASYAIGVDIGSNLKRQDLDLDPKLLATGLADGFAAKAQLSDAELKKVLEEFRTELSAKIEAKEKKDAEANLKAGEKYLAENAKKEGVKTTASGLQYKVLKAGTGKSPKATDTVKVHYHGTLIDGTVFDSSVDRSEPVTFGVSQVIPGWVEALQLMKEGDKWSLVIPAKLAYGERGAGDKIGPNSTLIFEVELLGIEKPASP